MVERENAEAIFGAERADVYLDALYWSVNRKTEKARTRARGVIDAMEAGLTQEQQNVLHGLAPADQNAGSRPFYMACAVEGICKPILLIGAFVLHLYTVYAIFDLWGGVAGVVGLALPGLSEVAAFAGMWARHGFSNAYTWATFAVIGLKLLCVVAAVVRATHVATMPVRGRPARLWGFGIAAIAVTTGCIAILAAYQSPGNSEEHPTNQEMKNYWYAMRRADFKFPRLSAGKEMIASVRGGADQEAIDKFCRYAHNAQKDFESNVSAIKTIHPNPRVERLHVELSDCFQQEVQAWKSVSVAADSHNLETMNLAWTEMIDYTEQTLPLLEEVDRQESVYFPDAKN